MNSYPLVILSFRILPNQRDEGDENLGLEEQVGVGCREGFPGSKEGRGIALHVLGLLHVYFVESLP